MHQVQIKQIPLISSTNTERFSGSWFPTGYYGHFRAKSRADLCNSFRQIARPNPPKKFIDRQNSAATSHMFSQHDNRFKFESDPLVRGTQAGFGKRKVQGNIRGEFDPFFIGWIPKNIDRKNYVDETKITSYTNDFNSDSTSSKILSDIQSINSPLSSSLPSTNVSIYSTVYNHGQPNSEQSKQIRRETFQRYSATQTRRSQLRRNERSTNVASCLVWNNKDNENKSINTITPIINQQKSYESQSMQTFKKMEQPRLSARILREDYNVNPRILPRAATSFDHIHTYSMQSLISKYM